MLYEAYGSVKRVITLILSTPTSDAWISDTVSENLHNKSEHPYLREKREHQVKGIEAKKSTRESTRQMMCTSHGG